MDQARIQRGCAGGARPPLFVPNYWKSPLNWPKKSWELTPEATAPPSFSNPGSAHVDWNMGDMVFFVRPKAKEGDRVNTDESGTKLIWIGIWDIQYFLFGLRRQMSEREHWWEWHKIIMDWNMRHTVFFVWPKEADEWTWTLICWRRRVWSSLDGSPPN